MQGCTRPAGGLPSAGYTLLELMVTIAISVLVLTLAVPNFASQISRQEVAVQSQELRTSLNVARSEAVMRQRNVYVCRRTGEGGCDISPVDRAEWSYGWIVFVDDNRNGQWDAADTLVKEVTRSAGGIRMFMNHRGQTEVLPGWLCTQRRVLVLLRPPANPATWRSCAVGRSRLAPSQAGNIAAECEPAPGV